MRQRLVTNEKCYSESLRIADYLVVAMLGTVALCGCDDSTSDLDVPAAFGFIDNFSGSYTLTVPVNPEKASQTPRRDWAPSASR